ncbi:PaaI family thioesterase [Roseitranquillus sediminis]|uniref:PaaI family thioesterase n=1 Tax=Roseitranquillus sediminis TaxID=2809051 RepID=UPI001D0C64CB|nr:PaaI family thioesterase [Roseitranquillus sediminis]MBM9596426.1 PaaI family thioesterase [Roseitranquillus sediminis]
MSIDARVLDSFARQSLMATFEARLEHAADGLCRISAPILPLARQQHGYGHAGLTFALGDSAAGYAALSAMDKGMEVLTVEMKINLIAPLTGDRVLAEGRVVRAGRRLVIVTAEVSVDGRQAALLQGTMIPVPA